MANTKISQLPGATVPLSGTEVLPLVQSGTTTQVSVDNLLLNTVDQADIGTAPNEIPLNGYLGSMAYQDSSAVSISGGTGAFTTLSATGNVTLGDASTDTVTVNGYMGVGIAPSSSNAVTVSTGAARAGRFIRTTAIPSSATYALEIDGSAQTGNMTASGPLNVSTNGKTNAFTIDGNGQVSVAGNTVLGDASTDTVTVNGYMGVGGVANSTRAIDVESVALTGTNQIGIYSSPRANPAATSLFRAFSSFPRTEAASFTLDTLIGYAATDSSKGAGSTITNQHGVYVYDQTQGANNYGITSLVSSGANKWNIYASGTAANYFAGSVGVGTTSPALPLHVYNASAALGYFETSNTGIGPYVIWRNGATSIGDVGSGKGISGLGNATDFMISSRSTYPLLFGTGSAERMRITSAGDVGIGTSSPEAKLHVEYASGSGTLQIGRDTGASQYQYINFGGNTAGDEAWQIGRSPNTGGVGGAGNFYFYDLDNSTTRMVITPAGNVGIGTTTPSENLDVSASVNGGGPTINVSNTYYAASSTDEYADFQAEFYQNDVAARRAAGYMRFGKSGDFSANASASSFLAFATRNAGTLSEKMRITSAGEVSIAGDTLIIATAKTPASATDTGTTGQIAWDSDYVYVCVATNTWKRSAISTW